MKYINLLKPACLLLLALLLAAIMVDPAAAQEPEEEGDVHAAYSFHGQANIVPAELRFDSFREGTTDLVIRDIEDVAAAELIVDFPVAGPGTVLTLLPGPLTNRVKPGELLNGLVEGEDYQLTACIVGTGGCANPVEPPPIPAGYNRIKISIVVLKDTCLLKGNGSLARITWRTPLVGPIPGRDLFWQRGLFRDRDGNVIQPCNGLPGCPAAIFPVVSSVSIEVNDQTIRAQVSSEGNKPLNNPDPFNPMKVVFSDITVVPPPLPLPGPWPPVPYVSCPLDPPDAHFQCGYGGSPITVFPVNVFAVRRGYLPARATTVQAEDLPNITLLAGDVTGDGTINIADIASIAADLDNVVGATNVHMDFNNSGQVDIGDLALAAKNYGKSGVINWRTGNLE